MKDCQFSEIRERIPSTQPRKAIPQKSDQKSIKNVPTKYSIPKVSILVWKRTQGFKEYSDVTSKVVNTYVIYFDNQRWRGQAGGQFNIIKYKPSDVLIYCCAPCNDQVRQDAKIRLTARIENDLELNKRDGLRKLET